MPLGREKKRGGCGKCEHLPKLMQIKTCCEPGEAKQVQSISEAQTKRPYRQNFRWLRLVRMRNTHQKHLKESLINFF